MTVEGIIKRIIELRRCPHCENCHYSLDVGPRFFKRVVKEYREVMQGIAVLQFECYPRVVIHLDINKGKYE